MERNIPLEYQLLQVHIDSCEAIWGKNTSYSTAKHIR